MLAYAGRSAEAVAAAETALRFDPRPPAATFLAAGLALYLNGRYDRAVEMLERARDLAPGLNESPEFLGMAYAQAGALGKAKAEANALLEYFPSASLRYFRIVYAHHRRSEDLTRRLDGLGKAGIPEWPFGFEVRPDRRIDGTQVQALTNSQIWRGQHENGEQFLLQVTDDGTAAYSSPSSLRTGRLFFRDDMLCYESKDFMLGRPNCGHVYRDGETQFDYVYVNAFSVMRFSLAQ